MKLQIQQEELEILIEKKMNGSKINYVNARQEVKEEIKDLQEHLNYLNRKWQPNQK